MRYKIFRALTVTSLLVLMASARGFAVEPDATVRMTGKSIAAGVGFSWGSGVLTYEGKEYPFSITGLSAGDIGITSVEVSGNVFNLKKPGSV